MSATVDAGPVRGATEGMVIFAILAVLAMVAFETLAGVATPLHPLFGDAPAHQSAGH